MTHPSIPTALGLPDSSPQHYCLMKKSLDDALLVRPVMLRVQVFIVTLLRIYRLAIFCIGEAVFRPSLSLIGCDVVRGYPGLA